MEDSKCLACHGILPEDGEVVLKVFVKEGYISLKGDPNSTGNLQGHFGSRVQGLGV